MKVVFGMIVRDAVGKGRHLASTILCSRGNVRLRLPKLKVYCHPVREKKTRNV